MINPSRHNRKKAQSAVEYLLLLAVVAVIVFVGFKTTILPQTQQVSSGYFNKVANGIMGEPPDSNLER